MRIEGVASEWDSESKLVAKYSAEGHPLKNVARIAARHPKGIRGPNGHTVTLQKKLNRRVGGIAYMKYLVAIPPDVVNYLELDGHASLNLVVKGRCIELHVVDSHGAEGVAN